MQSFAPSAVSLAILLAALAIPGTAAAQGMKIGVVDVQRAVMQSEDGLRAQASLKKIFDSRQQELTKRQNDLQKQKDDIDRQKNVLSQQALQKKADEWQKEMVELQSTYVEYNKELEKKQKELTDPIFERVIAAIKRVAGLDSYDVIVDRATVAFARTDIDLTDRVVQMANGAMSAAPAPGGAGAPAPKAAAPAPATAAPAKP
jgi:outer membrane protein